jgi:DNA-binding NtrC family response regulator
MHPLGHGEKLVLQLVEFLQRHDLTLPNAKVGWYTGFCVDVDIPATEAKISAHIQVLIADDSEAIRHAIRLLLQSESNFVTDELGSFTELVAALKSTKPDVVLMDLHMPGEEHADMVKEHTHGTCLIAMSLWDDPETQGLAESVGAARLLQKSTLATTLIDAIHECMSKT